MPDLLIELFSEEIPARMQMRAAADLQKLITNGLVEAGLTYASAGAFSTPRRLALSVEGLLAESPATREERKGPRVDAPEKALEGFLRATGLTRDQLETRDDKKGQVYFAVIAKPGRPAAEIVAEVLEQTIRNFPWPKSMRWGAGALRWVRPLHSILCILTDEAGAQVVPLKIENLSAGDTTRGHRFMAPDAFAVTSFDDYAAKLKRAHVVLDAAARAEHIWADAANMAFAHGLEVVEDKGLLAEVAGLVEWPVVLMGDIGDDFLGLPPEVLQTSMREHQKFFSVRNPKTGRIEKFVTVANVETADNGATILAGNQKVLAARLSDAKFFWENDLRTVERHGMSAWTDQLANVTFHAKLGSQAERISRIAALAREIAPIVGADADEAELAAKVAKADLSSEMVYEFPELQGIMGRYYSKSASLSDAVAAACAEHYAPLGPTDDVPTAPVSVAVALADKIDTLTGFWAIDEKPTGSKDPYALRRAALGVIRLVLENGVRISLSDVIFSSVLVHYLQLIFGLNSPQNLVIEAEKQGFEAAEMTTASYFKDRIGVLGAYFFPDERSESIFDDLWLCAEPNWLEDNAKLEFEATLIAIASGSFDFSEKDIQASPKMLVAYARRYREIYEFFNEDKGVAWDSHAESSRTRFIHFARDLELAALHPNLSEHRADWNKNLLSFFHDRLKVFLKDRGIRHDVIDACIAMPGNDDLTLLVKRAEALADFLKTDDGTNLLQGFKRANNILAQAEAADGVEYSYGADEKFAETDEERALFAALNAQGEAISAATRDEDFAAAMSGLAALRAPVDAFFEAVQVNADNKVLRRNRLNMLAEIRKLCAGVADLTKIEG